MSMARGLRSYAALIELEFEIEKVAGRALGLVRRKPMCVDFPAGVFYYRGRYRHPMTLAFRSTRWVFHDSRHSSTRAHSIGRYSRREGVSGICARCAPRNN